MARNKVNSPNITPPSAEYPNGRIKDNDGSNNGTPVNEFIYGDLHETFAKLMRRYAISYNNLPDNEINGFQIVEALRALPSKNDKLTTIGIDSTSLTAALKVGSLEVNEVFIGLSTVDSIGSTNFKGTLDNQTKNINLIEPFLSGDYLMLINTQNNVTIFPFYRANSSSILKKGIVNFDFDANDLTVSGSFTGGEGLVSPDQAYRKYRIDFDEVLDANYTVVIVSNQTQIPFVETMHSIVDKTTTSFVVNFALISNFGQIAYPFEIIILR